MSYIIIIYLLLLDVYSFSIKSHSNNIPFNIVKYTRKNPLKCKVEDVKMIGRFDDSCEFYHISLSHEQQFLYFEGQYCTIIPPNDPITNKRHAPRSYSIANSNSNIIELCVRKFINPKTNSPGLCSNYLINSKIGDIINLSGPFGRLNIRDCLSQNHINMEDSNINYGIPNIILVATGTGIAPFRAFYKYLFNSNSENLELFNKLLLVYGVRNEKCLLYSEELHDLQSKYPDKFTFIKAFSRVSDKKYVQNIILDNGNFIKSLVDTNTRIFICGNKNMSPAVKQAFKDILTSDLYNIIQDKINIEVY